MSEDGECEPGGGRDHVGTPRPDALIPALDQGQLAELREIGREWDRVSADRRAWRQALPVDPSLGEHPGRHVRHGAHRGRKRAGVPRYLRTS
jgi:hypothetical protein